LKRTYYLALSVLVIVADLVTKSLVSRYVEMHDAITIVPDFFQIVHVRNTGAAFGIGANASSRVVPLLLNFGAIAVFCVVVIYAVRSAVTDRLLQVGLHLILGGAIGNLVDRFRFGYVVDFLRFYVTVGGREHEWPSFNVADSAICIGIALLFLDMRRKPQESEAPAAVA
jgi:signal peptidase II